MAWTQAKAAQALAGGGWELVRVPGNGQRERERWRVISPVHGEDYAFSLLAEVERFWKACYIGRLEAAADAATLGRLHATDHLGLRGTIDLWLETPGAPMTSALRETLKSQRQPVASSIR